MARRQKNIVRSTRFAPVFESLEPRQLLAANVLAGGFLDNINLNNPGDTHQLQLDVDSQEPLIFAFDMTGQDGLDPGPISIESVSGHTIAPIASSNGPTTSTFLAELGPGSYEITVLGDGGTTGSYDLAISLVGDLDGDAQVGSFEEQWMQAAMAQASGMMNAYTAEYYSSLGIPVDLDLYNLNLDANRDGTVDGQDYACLATNLNAGNFTIELTNDSEAPAIVANLANDTGKSDTDGITTDITIVGNVTDAVGSAIVSFQASMDRGGFVDILGKVDANGNFTLTQAELETISGGSLDDGAEHTLSLIATDEYGNASEQAYTVDFTLDTIAPVAPGAPDLDDASDLGYSNTDNLTVDNTPTFTIIAEAGATVELYSDVAGLIGQGIVDASGVITLTSATLADGDHAITAKAIDVAGNESAVSDPLAIIINTTLPAAPVHDLAAASDTGDQGDQLTSETSVTIEGTTDPNTHVEILGTAFQATSDASGNFSFANVPLTFGQNIITVRATSESGAINESTTTYIQNNAPTAMAVAPITINENDGTVLIVNLSNIFGDVNLGDGDALTYLRTSTLPAWLSDITIQGGKLYVTTEGEQYGTSTIEIKATDTYGEFVTGGVNLTVAPVNDLPVNNAPTFNGIKDEAVVVGNIHSYFDDEETASANLTIEVTGSTNGDAFIDNGVLTFIPTTGFYGSGTVTVSVTDTEFVTDAPFADIPANAAQEFTLNFNIANQNHPVVANDVTAPAVDEDSTQDVLINVTLASDAETALNDLAFEIINATNVGGGVFAVTGGTVQIVAEGGNRYFRFTPEENWNGTTSFDFQVTDEAQDPVAENPATSDTATVTITVNPINDAPVANDNTLAIDEDSGPVDIPVANLLSDVETDLASLIASMSFSDVTGGTVEVVDVAGVPTFRFTPTENYHGDAGFTYSVTDTGEGPSGALSDSGTVDITINAVNDPPVATSGDPLVTTEDSTVGVEVDLRDLVTDLETTDENLTFNITSETNGTVQLIDGHIARFTPSLNYNFKRIDSLGTANFTYTVEDTGDGTADPITVGPVEVTVLVTPVNDDPVAVDDAEDVPLYEPSSDIYVLVNDFDPDNDAGETDTLTIVAATIGEENKGTVTFDDEKLIYTPQPGATEEYTVTISYTIEDDFGGQATADAVLTVVPNVAPEAEDDSFNVNQNGSVGGDLLANDNDDDGDDLAIVDIDTTGMLGGDSLVVNPDGTFTYDLTGSTVFDHLGAGETATETFTYTVSDGKGGTDTATVTITVQGANDDPVAVDDDLTVEENGSIVGYVLSNDTDVDTNDTLTVTSHDATSEKGIPISIAADGSFTYDLTGSTVFDYLGTDESTTDTFSYEMSDGKGGTDTATVTITVTGVNDPPVGGDDSDATNNSTAITIDVLDNDSDAETPTLTPTSNITNLQVTSDLGASVSINPSGLYYDPTGSATLQGLASGQQMTDYFTYTLTDGEAVSGTITVTVVVSGSGNTAPQVDSPIADITLDDGDAQPDLIDLTSVFSDIDGHGLSFSAVSSNTNLVTVQIVNGTDLQVNYLYYSPDQDRTPAEITVTATETNSGDALTADDQFTVTVNPVQPMEFYLVALDTATNSGTAFYTTTLPESITEVTVGNNYVVEVWATHTYYTTSSLVNGNPVSLAAVQGDLEFDNDLSTATSVGHAGAFDGVSASGTIDNANGVVDDLGGGSTLPNVGVSPNYSRVGYVVFNAKAAGTQEYTFDVEMATMLGVGSETNLSQVNVTGASVEHQAVEGTYEFVLEDNSSVDVSGTIGGEAIEPPEEYPDATTTNAGAISGVLNITLDNYDTPTTMTVVSGILDPGLYEGGMLSPGVGGAAGKAEANFGFVTNTYELAVRELSFTFQSNPITITGTAIPDASEIIATCSGGFIDYHGATSGRIDLTALSSDKISIQSGEMGGIYNSAGSKMVRYPCHFTVDLSDTLGPNSQVTFYLDTYLAYDPPAPIMGTVAAEDTPTDVAMSVVKTPTATDAKGEVAELPQSEAWLDEWDSHWVEVWVKTEEGSGIQSANVDLAYNGDYFTATEIEYSPAVIGDFTGDILTDGIVSGFGGTFDASGVGVDGHVLLGRVKFESLADDGIELDVESFGVKSYDLGLELSVNNLQVAGVDQATVGLDRVPTTELWAMPYDINDDDVIDLLDFSKLLSQFRTDVTDSDNAMAQVVDFNSDGTVNLQDMSFLLANFRTTKESGEDIYFPTNFTQRWIGSGLDTTGESSTGELLDAATEMWQTMLGTEAPIDIQLVVTDLGDKQLAEAEILATDQNGQPIAGRLTLDDDAAGLGWYSQIDGTPDAEMYDLYTVMLHEIGHTLGFMGSYDGFAANLEMANGQVTFVDAGTSVAMDTAGNHIADANLSDDLMAGTLDPGVRKLPSELDAQMILAAYEAAEGGASGFAAVSAAITAAEATDAVTIATTDFSQIGETLVGEMTWDRLFEAHSKKVEASHEADAPVVDALFAYESSETSAITVRSDSELESDDKLAIDLAELFVEENATDETVDNIFEGWDELL